MARIAVVMPAFNESEGIGEFLAEIGQAMAGHELRIVVVDDASVDGTASAVEAAASSGLPVEVVRSEVNRGHGPSTLRALSVGLEGEPDVVVAVDGDGQFVGGDIASVALRALSDGLPVEGVRLERTDPWFRRIASAATRLLVRIAGGVGPRDANTPLRSYPAPLLGQLLERLPPDLATPNLFVSALLRRAGVAVIELPVRSIPRRGSVESGSTWGQRMRQVPSRRFIGFCWRALSQWLRLRGGARLA